MIFKITGSVLIVSGTGIFGLLKSVKLHKRYKNLVKLEACFVAMANEISFSNDCIDVILLRVSQICEFNKIFSSVAGLSHDKPLSQRWKESIKNDAQELYLSKSDCEILCMLAGELGMTDREGQLKNIEHIRNLLKQAVNEAYEEYARESKMLKGLGIMAGMFLVILLI